MTVISVFQCLPLHIAEAVARYCVYSRLDPNFYRWEEENTWTELYNVSYSWRALALQFFFNEITLRLSIDTGKGRFEFRSLPDMIKVDVAHYKLVKKVAMESNDPSQPRGVCPLNDFSSFWPEAVMLPSARHLHADIRDLLYEQDVKHNDTWDSRFYWISQHIMTAMPNLQRVTLEEREYGVVQIAKSPGPERKAGQVLIDIINKVTTAPGVNRIPDHLSGDYLPIRNRTELTSLECDFSTGNDLFGRIINLSASTLESLKYRDPYLHNMRSLIFDDKGNPVVYPRLQKLDVFITKEPKNYTKPRVDESIIPFPVLRHLTWKDIYAFEDDTLFRGNSGTLEYLDICVYTRFADILQRYKVFSGGKYSRLNHVSVLYCEPDDIFPMDPFVFLQTAVCIISPATTYLAVRDLAYFDTYIDAISASAYLDNIQVLNISEYLGGLPAILDIIKLMPNMTKLVCDPGLSDLKADSVQASSYIDDLYAHRFPLSRRLRHWETLLEGGDELDDLATTALVLAVLCPDLVLVFVQSIFRLGAAYRIDKAIKSGFHDKHIDKIWRLPQIVDWDYKSRTQSELDECE